MADDREFDRLLEEELSALPLPDAALSGIAGIGHIMVGVGLVLLVIMFKRVVNRKAAAARA